MKNPVITDIIIYCVFGLAVLGLIFLGWIIDYHPEILDFILADPAVSSP